MRLSLPRRAFLAGVLGATAAGLVAMNASAKTSFDSPYTLEQTFNAALRLVRVDMGFKVTEKDPSAAYVIFDYKSSESGDRVSAGSVEMVPSGDKVKVVVQLGAMPRYHEQVLMDKLAKKLRDEYGEPMKKPPPPPPPPPDGGTDGGSLSREVDADRRGRALDGLAVAIESRVVALTEGALTGGAAEAVAGIVQHLDRAG